jgi:flagellin
MMPGMYPEQDVTMLSVQTNYASLVAQQNYNANSDLQTKTITAITSGLRINQSGDDAAGLVEANQYRNQVAVLSQGVLNANNALSTLQIADGAMNNISNMLDRLQTLATQAASLPDGAGNDAEFQSVLTEIDREAANVGTTDMSVYIGGATPTVAVAMSKQAVTATGLGVNGLAVATNAGALAAIAKISTAVGKLGTAQGIVGAGENDLGYATSLANSQIANTSAAEGRIRDADMAAEAANLTKAQVLSQASLAAMAQANAAPQGVLTLLKG